MTELLKKISPKNVMESRIQAPDKATALYNVFGIARSTRSGESDHGPWTALVGGFEAIRISDRKAFQSPQVFLPEPMNSLLVEKLRGEEVNEIEFAVTVGLKPANVPCGYEYTCSTLVEADQADPLADLRNKVLALEAPKSSSKKTSSK